MKQKTTNQIAAETLPVVSEWWKSHGKLNGGRASLINVVEELQRQVECRKDIVVDTRSIKVIVNDDGNLALAATDTNAVDIFGIDGLPIQHSALSSFASRMEPPVPIKFLSESTRLHGKFFAEYLTHVLHNRWKKRLVRILDGKVRAFLSDQYRCIDNLFVIKSVLDATKDVEGMRVLEASLTDTNFRVKLVSDEIWQEIERVRTTEDRRDWYAGALGDQKYASMVAANSRNKDDGGSLVSPNRAHPCMVVSNSETGNGSMEMSAGILMAICFNFAKVYAQERKVHLGSRLETGVYTAQTIEAEAETIYLKIRDTASAFFTPEKFADICESVHESASQEIKSPVDAVNLIVSHTVDLHDSDLGNLLQHFVAQPGRPSVYNLGQAVCRLAQEADADRADKLEALGGKILLGEHSRKLATV